MPPQEGWQSSSQNQQSANQQPDWQQQQAAAPPDPWQIAGQAQQGDAWQQAGQGQRDSWQSLPQQQAGVSSAAQMFQEAAQSLQDQTPGTQPQPPQQPQPAPRPAEEQTTQGGHMDLFSDSDQQEEQDKPKKRLSDLMPKLGPKT
jgi:hypothetical protein